MICFFTSQGELRMNYRFLIVALVLGMQSKQTFSLQSAKSKQQIFSSNSGVKALLSSQKVWAAAGACVELYALYKGAALWKQQLDADIRKLAAERKEINDSLIFSIQYIKQLKAENGARFTIMPYDASRHHIAVAEIMNNEYDQVDRIVDIATTAVMYGVPGGSLHREAFKKQIHSEFNTGISTGEFYVDEDLAGAYVAESYEHKVIGFISYRIIQKLGGEKVGLAGMGLAGMGIDKTLWDGPQLSPIGKRYANALILHFVKEFQKTKNLPIDFSAITDYLNDRRPRQSEIDI